MLSDAVRGLIVVHINRIVKNVVNKPNLSFFSPVEGNESAYIMQSLARE